jgi:uncharacterized protein YraI
VKAILAGVAMMTMAVLPTAAEAANAITAATVNFRAAPSGAVVGTIPHGSPVTVLGRSGNWCQAEWLGHIGWVYCRYLHAAVARAPVETYDPYFYGGYPYYRYGAPFVGFSLGLGFDRSFRHRHHRHHRFDGRHFRSRGDGVRVGRGGGGRGGFSGGSGYLVQP